MATRGLFDIFILLRNNSLQSKFFPSSYDAYDVDEKCALISNQDIEMGILPFNQTTKNRVKRNEKLTNFSTTYESHQKGLVKKRHGNQQNGNSLIENQQQEQKEPRWLEIVNEVNYGIEKIGQKIIELDALHVKKVSMPTLDDSTYNNNNNQVNVPNNNLDIQKKSKQITQMLQHCQSLVKRINNQKHQLKDTNTEEGKNSPKEIQLKRNITTFLAKQLCDLTLSFRRSQSTYLKEIERFKTLYEQYNTTPTMDYKTTTNAKANVNHENITEHDETTNTKILWENKLTSSNSQNLTTDNNVIMSEIDIINHQQSNDNSLNPNFERFQKTSLQKRDKLFSDIDGELSYYRHKEKEINSLVQSIQDLNTLFQDIGTLVQDQGTTLDRIDYSIEHSTQAISTGLTELTKAATLHSRASYGKLLCIFSLAFLVLLLCVALIILKL